MKIKVLPLLEVDDETLQKRYLLEIAKWNWDEWGWSTKSGPMNWFYGLWKGVVQEETQARWVAVNSDNQLIETISLRTTNMEDEPRYADMQSWLSSLYGHALYRGEYLSLLVIKAALEQAIKDRKEALAMKAELEERLTETKASQAIKEALEQTFKKKYGAVHAFTHHPEIEGLYRKLGGQEMQSPPGESPYTYKDKPIWLFQADPEKILAIINARIDKNFSVTEENGIKQYTPKPRDQPYKPLLDEKSLTGSDSIAYLIKMLLEFSKKADAGVPKSLKNPSTTLLAGLLILVNELGQQKDSLTPPMQALLTDIEKACATKLIELDEAVNKAAKADSEIKLPTEALLLGNSELSKQFMVTLSASITHSDSSETTTKTEIDVEGRSLRQLLGDHTLSQQFIAILSKPSPFATSNLSKEQSTTRLATLLKEQGTFQSKLSARQILAEERYFKFSS